jgi:hypothetical protein
MIKYSTLRIAYQKAEKEKVEYCEKYYEQTNIVEDLRHEIQMQDTVIEFLNDDNQILSSFLAEMDSQYQHSEDE